MSFRPLALGPPFSPLVVVSNAPILRDSYSNQVVQRCDRRRKMADVYTRLHYATKDDPGMFRTVAVPVLSLIRIRTPTGSNNLVWIPPWASPRRHHAMPRRSREVETEASAGLSRKISLSRNAFSGVVEPHFRQHPRTGYLASSAAQLHTPRAAAHSSSTSRTRLWRRTHLLYRPGRAPDSTNPCGSRQETRTRPPWTERSRLHLNL